MANKLKILALIGKIAGVVVGLSNYQAVIEQFNGGKYAVIGLIIFAIASILKDAVNRIGDILDDGEVNGSFSIENSNK